MLVNSSQGEQSQMKLLLLYSKLKIFSLPSRDRPVRDRMTRILFQTLYLALSLVGNISNQPAL